MNTKYIKVASLVLFGFITLFAFASVAEAVWDADCNSGRGRIRYEMNNIDTWREVCIDYTPPLPDPPPPPPPGAPPQEPDPIGQTVVSNATDIASTLFNSGMCANANKGDTKGYVNYEGGAGDAKCSDMSTVIGPGAGASGNTQTKTVVLDYWGGEGTSCPSGFTNIGFFDDNGTISTFCEKRGTIKYQTGGTTLNRTIVEDLKIVTGSSCGAGWTSVGQTRFGKTFCKKQSNLIFKINYSDDLSVWTDEPPPYQPGQDFTFKSAGGSGDRDWTTSPNGIPASDTSGTNNTFTTRWNTSGSKTVTATDELGNVYNFPFTVDPVQKCGFNAEHRVTPVISGSEYADSVSVWEDTGIAFVLDYYRNSPPQGEDGDCVDFTTPRRWMIDFTSNGSWDSDDNGRGTSNWTNCVNSYSCSSGLAPSRWNESDLSPGLNRVKMRMEWRKNFDCESWLDKYPDPANPGLYVCASEVTVDVTVVPRHDIDVSSTVAPNVSITGNQSQYSGTTNYTKTNIADGTTFTLTAPATSGIYNFSSWNVGGGGCSSVENGGLTCRISNMNADRTVTANYTEPTYTLSVNSSGASNVPISGTWPGTTNYSVPGITNGTSGSLTAPETSGGATFSSWTGCSSTSGAGGITCNRTMDSNRTVTAVYGANCAFTAQLTATPSTVQVGGTVNFDSEVISPSAGCVAGNNIRHRIDYTNDTTYDYNTGYQASQSITHPTSYGTEGSYVALSEISWQNNPNGTVVETDTTPITVTTIPPTTGTIEVTSTHPTTWTITGPPGMNETQGTQTTGPIVYSDKDTGGYTIVPATLPGLSYSVEPPGASQTLNAGTTIYFNITYTPSGGPLACNPSSQTVGTNEDATINATGGTGSYTWSGGGTPPTGSGSPFVTQYSTQSNGYTVTVDDGSTTANCTVIVNDGCGVGDEPFNILPISASREVGETQQFNAEYDADCGGPGAPTDVTSQTVWSSSNDSIASETATAGEFLGNSVGNVTITGDYNIAGLSDFSALAITNPTLPRQCEDGEDNDNDGFTDFSGGDPGCEDASDNDEAEQCRDTFDNDGDGNADYPNDLECLDASDNDEQGEPRFEEF